MASGKRGKLTRAQGQWLGELRDRRGAERKALEDEAQRIVESGAEVPPGPEHAALRDAVARFRAAKPSQS